MRAAQWAVELVLVGLVAFIAERQVSRLPISLKSFFEIQTVAESISFFSFAFKAIDVVYQPICIDSSGAAKKFLTVMKGSRVIKWSDSYQSSLRSNYQFTWRTFWQIKVLLSRWADGGSSRYSNTVCWRLSKIFYLDGDGSSAFQHPFDTNFPSQDIRSQLPFGALLGDKVGLSGS